MMRPLSKITLHAMDLIDDPWPFEPESVGGIINVHFLVPALLSCFTYSLAVGALLLIESVPGCGGNYLQLPKAGELKHALGDHFRFLFYKEQKVGPANIDAVTVKLVAEKKTPLLP
jgi:hypothetical protein